MLVLLLHLSGPGLLWALCALVQTLRQGHRELPSVHAATWNGGVALSGGGHHLCRRPRRVQPSSDQPPVHATWSTCWSNLNKSATCGGCGGCGGGWWWWYGRCVDDVSLSIAHHGHATYWVAEHLGASSRRPRHPFSALMAGEPPGRVPVYTALYKTHPVTPWTAPSGVKLPPSHDMATQAPALHMKSQSQCSLPTQSTWTRQLQ